MKTIIALLVFLSLSAVVYANSYGDLVDLENNRQQLIALQEIANNTK